MTLAEVKLDGESVSPAAGIDYAAIVEAAASIAGSGTAVGAGLRRIGRLGLESCSHLVADKAGVVYTVAGVVVDVRLKMQRRFGAHTGAAADGLARRGWRSHLPRAKADAAELVGVRSC